MNEDAQEGYERFTCGTCFTPRVRKIGDRAPCRKCERMTGGPQPARAEPPPAEDRKKNG